jgi:asparagine synthase (glutamine-hydrolysing)
MCGILAIIGPRPTGCDFDAALDTLRHRGPDDAGVFTDQHAWLGHRRLSIIDLGPGGHQPMVEPASGVVVTYNGEIYNYIELRRELEARGHVFRSHCDTEVLLHGYLEWDAACVERFNGMWAFVIWDPRQRRAFFSRDRFGVKPFAYAMVGGSLAIASEPKALVRAFPQLRQVDTSAIRDLLAETLVHTDERTFYASIKSLPGAHRGTFRVGDRRPTIEPYWRYPEARFPRRWDRSATINRFSELVNDAVKLRLRSDVEVGITISGGIDSTVILDAMAATKDARRAGVRSYTAAYSDSDHDDRISERKWARLAASRYPNVSVTEVEAPRDKWLEVLPKIVWHMDGPCRSPQAFPIWMIMEQARADGVPVLLDGRGADEVFGGYAHHVPLAVIDRALEGPRRGDAGWSALPGVARAGVRVSSANYVLRNIAIAVVPPVRTLRSQRSTLCDVLSDDFLHTSDRRPAASDGRWAPASVHGRLETQLYRELIHDVLPGLLRFGDTMSMAHSIETRTPFLDYRLVEFGVSLPAPARISGGWTKRVMRDYLRGVGQREIADRRDKHGFITPAWEWMAADQGAILREILLDRGAKISAIVDRPRLERFIALHAQGQYRAGEALYALLTTELWWQQV